MSDTSPQTPICQNPALHELHICELKRKGCRDEIARRTDQPAFLCHNCNATANRDEDLCNASPLAGR